MSVTRLASGYSIWLGREFDGASVYEVICRLLDEHWEVAALAAVRCDRAKDSQGWAEYLANADELAAADASVVDRWDP